MSVSVERFSALRSSFLVEWGYCLPHGGSITDRKRSAEKKKEKKKGTEKEGKLPLQRN